LHRRATLTARCAIARAYGDSHGGASILAGSWEAQPLRSWRWRVAVVEPVRRWSEGRSLCRSGRRRLPSFRHADQSRQVGCAKPRLPAVCRPPRRVRRSPAPWPAPPAPRARRSAAPPLRRTSARS
jgi:hypothetical protein